MKNNIKSFSIKGLFGDLDIEIPFDDNIKIFIGNNGLGKTHVLNIFYYTLTQNFDKLFSYHFEEVVILLKNNTKIAIQKKENFNENISERGLFRDVIEIIGLDGFHRLRNEISHGTSLRQLEHHSIYRKVNRIIPLRIIYSEFKNISIPTVDIKTKNKIEKLMSNSTILYLPTFRRVEEDMKNLGYDENLFEINREDDRLIHFGMDDVQSRFSNYTRRIDWLSKKGFSQLSSEILSQLVKGLPPIDNNFFDELNYDDIDIILSRVGSQISKADKNRIKEILDTKEIKSTDHSALFFLQKLIKIYDAQRIFDNTIRNFVEICNKYLTDKKVIYDESAIDIYIKKPNAKKKKKKNAEETDRLDLSDLSSGEKQIISIFSKIYLTNNSENFIILIDEPELSLSVFWQEMLLPDILSSKKCNLLIAATHSPFIYEDSKIEECAINLQEYITRKADK